MREVVLEGMRAVDDALVDEVVVVLARLTRSYVSENRREDSFFRGVRRMVSDLTADELDALTQLIERVFSQGIGVTVDEVRLEHERRGRTPADALDCNWLIVGEDGKPKRHGAVEIGPLPFVLRLFQLMKVNDLGQDSVTGSFAPHAGPGIIHIRTETLSRLWRLLV